MKRILTILMATLLLWGCDKPQNENTEPVFRLVENSAEVGSEGGTVTVTLETNVEYYSEVSADWVSEVETKSYESKTHTFVVEPNTSEEDRTAVISFCGNMNCIPFTITQEAAAFDYQFAVP